MKEYTDVALTIASEAGADFCDMRIVEERQNRIYVRRRSLKRLDETDSFGYGIRILLNGAWGFAFNTRLSKDDVAKTARLAVQTARASSKVPKPLPARMAKERGNIYALNDFGSFAGPLVHMAADDPETGEREIAIDGAYYGLSGLRSVSIDAL